MQNEFNFKNFEEDIFFLLSNPGKINRISFIEQTYKNNVQMFADFIKEKNREIFIETLTYFFAKTLELNILRVIRPDFKKVWMSSDEVSTQVKTNLPGFLHELVIEAMAGCENALERFLPEIGYDENDYMTKIQFIGEMICNKYKLYDITVDGYSNANIAVPSELYVFANNVLLGELAKEGYTVDALSENFNSPISCVLSKNGLKMAVLESIVIEPAKPKFPDHLKRKLVKFAEENMCVPYLLAVGVSSKDENAFKNNIVLKNGQTVVKRSDFIKIQ